MTAADDILSMLADSEDAFVTDAGATVPCFLVQHDTSIPQDRPGPPRLQRDMFAQTAASLVTDLVDGATVQVNGEPMRVLRQEMVQDGLMVQVWLGRPKNG